MIHEQNKHRLQHVQKRKLLVGAEVGGKEMTKKIISSNIPASYNHYNSKFQH